VKNAGEKEKKHLQDARNHGHYKAEILNLLSAGSSRSSTPEVARWKQLSCRGQLAGSRAPEPRAGIHAQQAARQKSQARSTRHNLPRGSTPEAACQKPPPCPCGVLCIDCPEEGRLYHQAWQACFIKLLAGMAEQQRRVSCIWDGPGRN
jgi:hypothetical protein